MYRNVVISPQEKLRKLSKARPIYYDDRGDDRDNMAGKHSFPASFFLIKEKCDKQAGICNYFALGTILDSLNLNNKKHGVL